MQVRYLQFVLVSLIMQRCRFLVNALQSSVSHRLAMCHMTSLLTPNGGSAQKFLMQPGIPTDTAVRVYRRYLKIEPTHAEEYIAYLKSKVLPCYRLPCAA